MSKVTLEYSGTGEKFLARLQAMPRILDFCVDTMTALHLGEAWRGVKSVRAFEAPRQGRIAYTWNLASDTVSVYPLLCGGRPDFDVYAAFGLRHWHRNLGPRERLQWVKAMIYPCERTLEKFAGLIASGSDYDSALRQFTSPDDRLVVIHLVNALKKNRVTASQARHLDLHHYPPTAAFMTAEKPYSALPILRTFRPGHEDKDSFARAFAEYCLNRGKFLSSSTAVQRLYTTLFAAVALRR